MEDGSGDIEGEGSVVDCGENSGLGDGLGSGEDEHLGTLQRQLPLVRKLTEYKISPGKKPEQK